MGRVIKLKESDLTTIIKRVIDEQTSCPPRIVTKQMIDSFLPEHRIALREKIELEKNELLERLSAESEKKMVDVAFASLINETFNLVYSIGVKTNYARFNFSPHYDQTSDTKKVIDNITAKLISKLESSYIFNTALKVFITKDNLNDVKKVLSRVLTMIVDRVAILVHFSDEELFKKIIDKVGGFSESYPYCPITTFRPSNLTRYNARKYQPVKELQLFVKLNEYV
jgi:hypothetical protein